MLKEVVKRAKNPFFGHFIMFGWSNMADTAYSDREKRFLSSPGHERVSMGHYSCIIISQKSQILGRVLIRMINYAFSIIVHQNSPELGFGYFIELG